MTIYDADCGESRAKLSESLIEMLESSGFQEVKVWGTREIVYERHIDGADRMRVRVYTSLADSYYDGDAMPRYRGEDSIKIITLYTTKRTNQDKGIARGKKRVYRTGKIEEILERTLVGMRHCYQVAQTPDLCSDCGSPMFKTKKTKHKPSRIVCAEMCWKKEETPKYKPRGRAQIIDKREPRTIEQAILDVDVRDLIAKEVNALVVGNQATEITCPKCETKEAFFLLDLTGHPCPLVGWRCRECKQTGHISDLL